MNKKLVWNCKKKFYKFEKQLKNMAPALETQNTAIFKG